MFRRLAWLVADLAYPPRCVVCGNAGAWLCGECLERVRPVPDPRCPRCSGPGDASTTSRGCCSRCARCPPAFRGAVAAGVYDGVLRTAIRALKYKGVREVGEPLGRLAADQIAMLGRHRLVVPVPPHHERTASRGLDHAAIIATAVARQTGLQAARHGLIRVRPTVPQFSLAPGDRRANVAGAFEARQEVVGREVILVDDVHTTGATADECSATLLRGGALVVDVCTVARALLPGR